jgi:hypothetical protein
MSNGIVTFTPDTSGSPLRYLPGTLPDP